jgi:hypothetical protein
MATGVAIPELEKGRDGKCCAPPGAQSLIPIPSISKQMTRLDPLALTRDSSVNVVERKVEGPLGEQIWHGALEEVLQSVAWSV